MTQALTPVCAILNQVVSYRHLPRSSMPPRLNKRQQRELEELEALGGQPEQASSDAELADDPIPIPKAAAGGFAAVRTVPPFYHPLPLTSISQLMAGNDEESEDEEIDQTKPSKSRKVGDSYCTDLRR
jgi:hypothetical protein